MSNKMSAARKERIAEILVEAFITGNDKAVSEKNGISSRSLRNYRQRLQDDPELATFFRDKKAKASDGWEDEIPGAMRSSINFIRRAAEQGNPEDPGMLHAVAGALKMVSGVASTWRVLDVRFPDPKKNPKPEPGSATVHQLPRAAAK